jgi:hypothetical protein
MFSLKYILNIGEPHPVGERYIKTFLLQLDLLQVITHKTQKLCLQSNRMFYFPVYCNIAVNHAMFIIWLIA